MILDRTQKSPAVPERVLDYLGRSPLGRDVTKVLPLTGDASDRRYFRAIRAAGDSVVIALHGSAFEYHALPFARVAELLGRISLPVPAILDHAGELGILALQDLGDVTLQAHLGAGPATEHMALYRRAVEFIEVLQRRGDEMAAAAYPPYGVAFDEEKLTWELDFFLKHFIGAYRGATIDPSVWNDIRTEWQPIVRELAAEPRVLCHRDYHSRNLMLHERELYIIDFQDARMGPDTYDLVSLLRDSYVDVREEAITDLIAYFLALKGRQEDASPGTTANDARAFRVRFDVMALQRNLKALGTFGYQTSARGNTVYIQYIPRTLTYVRDNLVRYPRFEKLRRLLANLVDELA
ncbi:MAG: phosphotransferase [Acidobacteria bacterium]|nr:phosphotransferase [Acidobacteriota bacterium]MBI3264200.1 phosphotransferase [Acidobacteriota bacterium]